MFGSIKLESKTYPSLFTRINCCPKYPIELQPNIFTFVESVTLDKKTTRSNLLFPIFHVIKNMITQMINSTKKQQQLKRFLNNKYYNNNTIMDLQQKMAKDLAINKTSSLTEIVVVSMLKFTSVCVIEENNTGYFKLNETMPTEIVADIEKVEIKKRNKRKKNKQARKSNCNIKHQNNVEISSAIPNQQNASLNSLEKCNISNKKNRKQKKKSKKKQQNHHKRLNNDNHENNISIMSDNNFRAPIYYDFINGNKKPNKINKHKNNNNNNHSVLYLTSCVNNDYPPHRNRQTIRKISECSDDSLIICFTDDNDVLCRNDGENKLYNWMYSNGNNDESDSDSGLIMEDEKKVRFNLNLEIHEMRAWNFAYRQARKGHWEQIGRDRVRFHERIQRTEKIISPYLQPEHRSKIFSNRFMNNQKILK